jgi:cysteine synthase
MLRATGISLDFYMPGAMPKEVEALIKARGKNHAQLKRTQQKVESLEAAIQALQNSRFESDRKRKTNPN